MSIRLDPRRLGTLKQLAAEAGVRPGDLVRQWVEERIDAARSGAPAASPPGPDLLARLDRLEQRLTALESGSTSAASPAAQEASLAVRPEPAAIEVGSTEPSTNGDGPSDEPAPRRRRSASAAPSGPRVGLHDEMIAVISERGPLTAAELAQAISERGRYAPPRSGKSLDAATVSQRASNPTYRSRFVRREGRIGLAQPADEG
jgi:chemotaxis protein histidine kinase CheA